MKKLEIGSRPLTLEDVVQVSVHGQKVSLSEKAKVKMLRSCDFLRGKLKNGDTIYGVNTGFGLLSNVKISDSEIEQLQRNLLRSHAVGTGHPMPDTVVRAMMLLRASNLAVGHSGVRPKVVEQFVEFLNNGIHPIVPQQGSVGASGDLAPLAHLSLVLMGEGRARVKGETVSGKEALHSAGIEPITLEAKEGLALINGTQFMTAIGALTLVEAKNLCDLADLIGALSVEALRGTSSAFEEEIHSVRPHPGQIRTAERMRAFLNVGKGMSEIAESHKECSRVQDPYSLRCIPQVHGASRDVFGFVEDVLNREMNSVTDNPLIFPEREKILSGGNFHGQIVAMAMDMLSIAVAELASISEQRMQKLINPAFSELPAFLAPKGGLNSGFMIVQVAAASVVSENKTLCHPASVDSIPTSADKEDHVSMGAWAARKSGRVTTNVRRVLSMELLTAAQAIDLLRPLKTTPVLEKLHQAVRKVVPFLESDRSLYEDFEKVEGLILSDDLIKLAQV